MDNVGYGELSPAYHAILSLAGRDTLCNPFSPGVAYRHILGGSEYNRTDLRVGKGGAI